MKNLTHILSDPIPFLENIFSHLSNDRIDVSDFELDHICYRVDTFEKYILIKTALEKNGELLKENKINGRLISVFKLHEPIVFNKRKIHLLELPAPKIGSEYASGWEHVEFAIHGDLNSFLTKYPHLHFDKKGFLKPVNPDLRLKYGNVSVKFHEYNLEYVINHLD